MSKKGHVHIYSGNANFQTKIEINDLVKDELTEAIYNSITNSYNINYDDGMKLSEFIFSKIPEETLKHYLPMITNYEVDDPFIIGLIMNVIKNNYIILRFLCDKTKKV
jgi:hypothetical protein